MRLLRKIYNRIFNPFIPGVCSHCHHIEYLHRKELAKLSYPGVTCYGYEGFSPSFEKRCRCTGFHAAGNLEYLEYKSKEVGL